jgi:rSAM/selenodomain-associated transferase 1
MLGDTLTKMAKLPATDRLLFYEEQQGAAAYFRQTAAGCRLYPQQGDNLGGRMANAFGLAFAEGYRAAVIIGTDSPDLPLPFIETAFRKLAQTGVEAIYGPSEDGGYYLLGLKRMYAELFRDIPWSSDGVLEKSLTRAERAGIRTELLPSWYDVDTAADLQRPELLIEGNGAPLTRRFIKNRNEDLKTGSRNED